ncbi:MAG: transcription-repair coupling factor [Bacteroidales bacterium]|nr:transcription-repair coupling factor [Bacteroidales bacterium]
MHPNFNAMIQEEIEQLFQSPEKDRLKSFIAQNNGNKKLSINGLSGSSLALAAAPACQSLQQNHLFVFPDKESSAFFYHDIEKMLDDQGKPLEEKRVHYFPSSYRSPYHFEDTDNANIKLRSEIINKLIYDQQHYVIVTYPEALSEKLVSTQFLKNNSFTVKKGEILPIDIFINFLYEYQYKQEDFVFEPGQFAWRGAIFDIFSFSEEYPYRIELSGDTVESIRLFDTNTQLSVREVDKLHIMPLVSTMETVEKRVSFFDFLSPEDIFWIKKLGDVKNDLHRLFKKANETYEQIETTIPQLTPEELYINEACLMQQVDNHKLIEIDSTFFHHYDDSIDFGILPQNAFNKKIELLLDEWIDNREHGYKTIFLTENEHQLNRMHHIILDLLGTYNQKQESNLQVEDLYTAYPFILHEGFRDEKSKLCLYTDHQVFGKYHRFVIRDRYKRSEAFTLKEIYDLQPGDFVVHIDHGIGVYKGLAKIEVNGVEQEVIKLEYKDGDTLFISIHSLHKISKYVGKEGTAPSLHRIGSGTWERMKERTKKRVKELAIDLIKLYAQRKAQKGFAFSPDNYLQTELEASFMYEDTPDQVKAMQEVKNDMQSDCPMDRLLCGDVGFGKTEIAIRAAFKAVCDNKQVAILVPTTVLALQHYNTFSERLHDFPCKIAYINRFRTTKQIHQTLADLKSGKIDILIGTHRILGKDVIFKDLGLLIIDEEQKFGVGAKEKLRELKVTVDTLTMSATPIPRTLQFSMMGARDISVIATPPMNRYPIQTEVHPFEESIIRDAISFELQRGGQVFVVHNKVQNIAEVAAMVKRLVPDARIAIGHGQMEGKELEKIMMDFIEGRYDVLVATTIVESGLDISNANTMIINDAQNFALNVLHQLRGRVGRNNKKAFCYMLTKPYDTLNEQARKRLKAIEDYSEIGSGFQIAMRDMDIRGAGDVLGADQSGFISEIGFEVYQKILNEAILELQEQDVPETDNPTLVERECMLETDLGLLFPSDYVASLSERMSLYKELDQIHEDGELDKFRSKLLDMFGALPHETEELLKTIPLRRKAAHLYFEKIVLKQRMMIGYFIENSNAAFYQSQLFGNILTFIQNHYPYTQIKENNKKLTLYIKDVPTIQKALEWFNRMEAEC